MTHYRLKLKGEAHLWQKILHLMRLSMVTDLITINSCFVLKLLILFAVISWINVEKNTLSGESIFLAMTVSHKLPVADLCDGWLRKLLCFDKVDLVFAGANSSRVYISSPNQTGYHWTFLYVDLKSRKWYIIAIPFFGHHPQTWGSCFQGKRLNRDCGI